MVYLAIKASDSFPVEAPLPVTRPRLTCFFYIIYIITKNRKKGIRIINNTND